MNEHEPTPWILGGCSGRMITTPSGYVGDGFIADFDTLENAEFAVRAVNSHDSLLAACKAIDKELMELAAQGKAREKPCLFIIDQVRNAIAKAERDHEPSRYRRA